MSKLYTKDIFYEVSSLNSFESTKQRKFPIREWKQQSSTLGPVFKKVNLVVKKKFFFYTIRPCISKNRILEYLENATRFIKDQLVHLLLTQHWTYPIYSICRTYVLSFRIFQYNELYFEKTFRNLRRRHDTAFNVKSWNAIIPRKWFYSPKQIIFVRPTDF